MIRILQDTVPVIFDNSLTSHVICGHDLAAMFEGNIHRTVLFFCKLTHTVPESHITYSLTFLKVVLYISHLATGHCCLPQPTPVRRNLSSHSRLHNITSHRLVANNAHFCHFTRCRHLNVEATRLLPSAGPEPPAMVGTAKVEHHTHCLCSYHWSHSLHNVHITITLGTTWLAL